VQPTRYIDFKEQKENIPAPAGVVMALKDEIDRDFPYQVPLSLDDKLVGVLDWLDERLGRWDMYVDLREQTIRYCFRDLADAQDFIRSFVKMRDAG
jgi:hypothetical protein